MIVRPIARVADLALARLFPAYYISNMVASSTVYAVYPKKGFVLCEDVTRALKWSERKVVRDDLAGFEWYVIKPLLPSRPRGKSWVDDYSVLK